MFERITTFISEARAEIRKVSWPSRRDAIRYTAAVIAMSIVTAAFLGGLDFVYQYIITNFILFRVF